MKWIVRHNVKSEAGRYLLLSILANDHKKEIQDYIDNQIIFEPMTMLALAHDLFKKGFYIVSEEDTYCSDSDAYSLINRVIEHQEINKDSLFPVEFKIDYNFVYNINDLNHITFISRIKEQCEKTTQIPDILNLGNREYTKLGYR